MSEARRPKSRVRRTDERTVGPPVVEVTPPVTDLPADLIAPRPEPSSQGLDAASKVPSGPIRATPPWGGSFGCAWENITRWLPEMQAASRHFPRATVPIIGSLMVIESCGNHLDDRGQVLKAKPDGYGGGRATGLMQLKDGIWQGHVAGANINDPAGNILIGARLIHDWIGETGSIEGMIAKYHPGRDPRSGATPETYARAVRQLMTEWPARDDDESTPAKRFWMAPWPNGFTRRIVQKPRDGDGRGWNSTPRFRGDRLTAIFVHHTAGGPAFGKDETVDLFERQRKYEALTEAVFDRDGTGYLMNDPWSPDPMEGSGRIPWASGPANNLSPAGAAFVRARGANAVNDEGFSAEHCHAAGESWSDAMLDLGAKTYAVILTRRGWDYEAFPRNPAIGNLWAALHHDDIANTTCPNMPADVWAAYLDAIRLEAKRLQVEDSISPPPPVDPTPPIVPPSPLPLGLPLDRVESFFGVLVRHLPDGRTKEYRFDARGSISLAWAKRCDDEGWLPAAHDWWADPDGRQYISFGRSEGDTDWILTVASLEGRDAWRWIDRPGVQP